MRGELAEAVVAAASRVRLAAFDVDGVLTDGRLVLGPNGEEYKRFHVRDGQGLVMLLDSGIDIAIISGRASPVVERRMAELGVRHVYQGCKDKLAALHSLCRDTGLAPEAVSFTGDDLPDLPVLRAVGFPSAVGDAHPAVSRAVLYRTRAAGGLGAVREIAELIMAAQGTLPYALASYGATLE
jgi:3-deoxy-D-manno-octulosonate 8-phosphate phosphatase (KDO 8-P phosphatase)